MWAELDVVFGAYEVVSEQIHVSRCDPLDLYSAGPIVSLVVPGLTAGAAYDLLTNGRPGLEEVVSTVGPGRASGFEMEGVAGEFAVFDDGDGELRVALSTGCYGVEDLGVADPYSLER